MLLLGVAAGVIACLAALATGRSLNSLTELRFSHTWILPIGLALQLTASFVRADWVDRFGLWLVLMANAIVAVFLFLNRQIAGTWIMGAGLALNVLVIAINGGMPVSTRAIEFAGAPRLTPEAEHIRLDASTTLPWLADVIGVPIIGTVVSVGDVVLALGIGVLLYLNAKKTQTD